MACRTTIERRQFLKGAAAMAGASAGFRRSSLHRRWERTAPSVHPTASPSAALASAAAGKPSCKGSWNRRKCKWWRSVT